MIVDVQGAAGTVVQSIPVTALSTNSTVKLKYFHFPALPLLDEFYEALTVNSEKFTVPASSSIEDIVNALDGFVQGGNRVCYVWYNSHEFELCVGTQAITLSAAFAAAMKLPGTLAANTCYSSVRGECLNLQPLRRADRPRTGALEQQRVRLRDCQSSQGR